MSTRLSKKVSQMTKSIRDLVCDYNEKRIKLLEATRFPHQLQEKEVLIPDGPIYSALTPEVVYIIFSLGVAYTMNTKNLFIQFKCKWNLAVTCCAVDLLSTQF